MPGDPYSDPVTGVLYNKLGLSTAAGLEAAEREITHAALILLQESPISPSYDLSHLREIHRLRSGRSRKGAGLNRCVIPVTATPELAARKMPLLSSWPRQQRPDIGCQFRVRQLAHCLWPAAGQPRHHRADTGLDPSPAPAVPAPRRLPEDSSR